MNKSIRTCLVAILLSCTGFTACAKVENATPLPETRDTLYQVSTLNSLMTGNYDGIETVAQTSQKGDLGIGTFDGLDGEMVMVDGRVYQVKDSGKVETPAASTRLPFLAVTFFDVDSSQDVAQVQNLDSLKAALDRMIVKKDRFYAIKIDGNFSQVKVRSVPRQQKPYPILSEVTKNQPVFNYVKVSGSLVGFWCPDYVGSINVPGYHLHFISNDRTRGGHLLEVAISSAKVSLDETAYFEMKLGGSAGQDGLITDAAGEINKVEK